MEMHPGPSDQELVRRAVAGDESAFEELVLRYHGRARRLAYGFVRDFDLADDVAQDAFLRAYRKLSGLADGTAFRSWLFQIVANRCRDELRRRKTRGESASLDDIAEMEEPGAADLEHRLHDSRMVEVLADLIAELPEAMRTPLVMKENGEMTYAEIAQSLGIPQGTAQIRVHRARLKLRAEMRARGLLAPVEDAVAGRASS